MKEVKMDFEVPKQDSVEVVVDDTGLYMFVVGDEPTHCCGMGTNMSEVQFTEEQSLKIYEALKKRFDPEFKPEPEEQGDPYFVGLAEDFYP